MPVSLRTNDGLALELTEEGAVAGLRWQESRLPVMAGGGFYWREAGAEEQNWLRTPLVPDLGAFVQKQVFAESGLTLEAAYASAGGYLSFSAKIADHTGRNRAIEVGYEWPCEARGWHWADHLRQSRSVQEAIVYRTTYSCPAGPGYASLFPFCALSRGAVGLSVGVPLAQGPRVYVLEYDHERRCLAVRFYLGLSPQNKKMPGQAWLSFMLYAHDGAWGLRSAAEKFYRFFPQQFARRNPGENYLGCREEEGYGLERGPQSLYGLPAPGDFGGWLRFLGRFGPAESPSFTAAVSLLEARERRREPYSWGIYVPASAGESGEQAEALTVSETPLTYILPGPRIVAIDAAWRFMNNVVAPHANARQLVIARPVLCSLTEGSALWPFFDVGCLPWKATEPINEAYARVAAYQRIVRYKEYAAGTAEPPAALLRQMLQRGVLYAIYPDWLPEAPELRELYLQYVPVIEQLSAAGWEPVTYARSSMPDVLVERYGRLATSNLCFAFQNISGQSRESWIYLEPALGLPTKATDVLLYDLLTGKFQPAQSQQGKLAFSVRLAPYEARAVRVLPKALQCKRLLQEAAEALQKALPLTPEEISYQPDRPGEMLRGDSPPGAQAATILCDGWKTQQGLVWAAGAPLTLTLDMNSPHQLEWLRVYYGLQEGYAAPAARVEGLERTGEWKKLGLLPAAQDKQKAWAEWAFAGTGEYQRVRLVYPALTQKLWIKEIEMAGRDGALVRHQERFRTLSAIEGFADFGLVSQLALALRVRRMIGAERNLQERALTALADFCHITSGLHLQMELPKSDVPKETVKGELILRNEGPYSLQEGNVKLRLPPGWSAAPGKWEGIRIGPGETARLPVVLTRAPEGGRLIYLFTGMLDGTPLFMSQPIRD